MHGYRSKNILLIAVLLLLITAVSCKKNDNSGKVVTMNVAPKLVIGGAAPPASPDNPAAVYYYSIIEDSSNQKYTLAKGTIQGFDYVEGYQYKIKVQVTPIAKPMADGPAETYTLIEVLSKTKVEIP
ncbi:DUF4377 domain-containing protein [Pedobacter sp. L105]|uniref:DUF4377 domain-containing protein n=1 Tax=Pedobacter sp. L105 TaxID=1641871 RepID=UPI00131D53E1|nr:DUF4377 domain-containing protein [Pedobacter sp. L105]